MKRLCLIVLLALLAALFSGCRYAVVESDSVRVGFVPVALAEEAGTLKRDDRDEGEDGAVRRLQERLAELGYLTGKIDGIFGAATEDALRRFQRRYGLPETGKLDAATEAALFPAPAATTAPWNVRLREGDQGDEVSQVQACLARYGFMNTEPTGEYDADTSAAVEAFQSYAVRYYGTEFDDPQPLLEEPELLSADVAAPTPTPTPTAAPTADPLTVLTEMPVLTPEPTLRPDHAQDGAVSRNLFRYLMAERFPVFRRTVQHGDSGEEVWRVQNRLIVLDYLYDEADAWLEESTVNALKCFQTVNGLQPTGIADAETQSLLFSDGARGLEKVEQPYLIRVSIDDQRVYVYRWMNGDYTYLIKEMICSTGTYGINATPKGRFISPGKRNINRWHYFVDHNCWAQYAFIIEGSILFHSVLYSTNSESSLRESSVYALGHRASHGCVRLRVEDAKWIWENCKRGQVIEIY